MTEITYPFDRMVPEGSSVMEVAPGILWLRMPLPFVLNHVNLWLIKDGNGWSVIDTGVTWNKARELWREWLKKYPLTRQIVTHYHPDHVGLSGWLEQETGASLSITQGKYLCGLALANDMRSYSIGAMVKLFRRHGLDDDRLNALKQRGNVYKKGFPLIPSTYRRIFDNDMITIGEHEWKVIVGYGHAPEHASFHCKERNVLISGDMLLPSISTNIPVKAANPYGNPLKDFLTSLRRYPDLPEDTLVLPSHGRPFIGIHLRVNQLEKHHQKRCEVLLDACSVPKTACDILPVLFERDIVDTHQCMFAMGESIAHMNYLEEQKKLVRIEGDPVRFVRS